MLLPPLPLLPPSSGVHTTPQADHLDLTDNLIATMEDLLPEVESVKDNPATLDLAVANPHTVPLSMALLTDFSHLLRSLLLATPMAVLLMMTIPRLASDGDHNPDTLPLSPDTPQLPPRRRPTITHHGDLLPKRLLLLHMAPQEPMEDLLPPRTNMVLREILTVSNQDHTVFRRTLMTNPLLPSPLRIHTVPREALTTNHQLPSSLL